MCATIAVPNQQYKELKKLPEGSSITLTGSNARKLPVGTCELVSHSGKPIKCHVKRDGDSTIVTRS